MSVLYRHLPFPRNAKSSSGRYCTEVWILQTKFKLAIIPWRSTWIGVFYADRISKILELLFFHCPYVVSIWYFLQRGGLNFSSFVSFFDIIQKLIHTPQTSSKAIITSSLIGATLWCLWLERNRRTFQVVDRSTDKIVDDILFI